MRFRHNARVIASVLIAATVAFVARSSTAEPEEESAGWSIKSSNAGVPETALQLQRAVEILDEVSLRYFETPKPEQPPVIPMQPFTPEELKKLIDHIRKIIEIYGLRTFLNYDRNGDGKLSGDELRDFLRYLIPCYDYVFTCKDRDALIERYLRHLLCANLPGCNPFEKEFSLDDFLNWLDRWISIYERRLAACSTHPPAEQAACRKPYEDALESLRKLRDAIQRDRPTPRPERSVSPAPSTSPAPAITAKSQVAAPSTSLGF